MKKQILNLGKTLNKVEQKEIKGDINQCPKCWIMTPKGCFLPDFQTDPECQV